MRQKKLTKSQQFTEECIKIFSTNVWDIENNWKNYQKFISTQSILKRLPSRPNYLTYVIKTLLTEFMQKYDARFLSQYLFDFDCYLEKYRNLWNMGFGINPDHARPYIPEYRLYAISSACKHKLHAQFNKDHPELAEADAVCAAYMELYARSGIEDENLKNRLKELTNNFDALIMANLPYIVDKIGGLYVPETE